TSIFIPNDLSNYADQPPGYIDTALNFMAILRIMNPAMLIPSTSSLELVKAKGQLLGLMAGANTITLHDATPKNKERYYLIYRTNRYKPKDCLFKMAKKAGLTVSAHSLLRVKQEDTIFYKFIYRNMSCNLPAVYFEGRRYTYRDLYRLTLKCCSFLKDLKIGEGQTLLLIFFDSIEFVVVFLSCLRLGIIAIPVDPQISKDEWDSIVSETGPERILATGSIFDKFKDKRLLKIADDESPEYFFSLLKGKTEYTVIHGVDNNNPAVILYTSGTTGKPKGVVHTYKDLFVDNFPRTVLKMTRGDIVFSCSRMHTSFGLGNSFLFPFHAGCGVILSRNIPNAFSIRKILMLRPTLFFAVPSFYDFLLRHGKSLGGCFKSIRLFVASGEKLNEDIFLRWKSRYRTALLECFGSSEMCHSFISNIPGRQKADSCGKPVKGFGVKFNRGRLFYAGPSLFAGYWHDNSLTRSRLLDGWFKSDDIGFMDAQGYVFLKGRDNLVYKTGGKWISVLDIENKLNKCALIEEVAAVKTEKGLEVHVCLKRRVKLDGAEEKIRGYCFRNLRIHELPGRIHFVNAIPRTRSGKIYRRKLEIGNET
ncbi:MAG: AMP-binding protein, partial [Candidatus Colwellbacteria bacterium]|nr:AMP-binding protein [Candidatus Colwellbacteria bacterium]